MVHYNLCSLSSSREDTEVVIIYGLTLPFPAPLSDGLLFLFLPDPTSFYLEYVSFIRKRPLDLISRGLIKEFGQDRCNENTTPIYLYDKKTRLP